MEQIWQVIGVAALALFVVAVALVAFRVSERDRRRPVEAGDNEHDDVISVLSVLPQAVVVLDDDDHVARASAAAYAFGLVRDDALAHPQVLQMVTALRRDGTIRDDELTLVRGPVHGAGTLRMQVRVAPLRGGRVLVLAEDRTQARRVEEMRRDFVANVSHELKTPVGAIGLLAETVAESADDPETVRYFAGRMSKESRRLGSLVQEIIELSRLQSPDALVDPELVEVDAVVQEAVDRVQVEAAARKVTLVPGGTPGLRVYGDEALLTTAVRNLLDNAVRYSSPTSRVSVGVSRDDALVRIAVVDQGTGIPEEMRERVFERFYRLDDARSRETGGSGLGLSIVKHIANDHGGRVELWSTEGRGSTFTLVLPEAYGPSSPDDALETTEATIATPRTDLMEDTNR
ncbi:sensor histidine kinase [Georgenia subflava]|uniref:Sensor-like histidine kinase SenX3 n=1 Tax=Georgenia subflava TaxID=1622177 RepID=A0A6N7EJH9_9MICO|nr:ATP-binding protein [Georgenia subflava]MPV37581.1 two-component sensor histidine kinase [Georgenia subflava]